MSAGSAAPTAISSAPDHAVSDSLPEGNFVGPEEIQKKTSLPGADDPSPVTEKLEYLLQLIRASIDTKDGGDLCRPRIVEAW
jgi:hypothetical protein